MSKCFTWKEGTDPTLLTDELKDSRSLMKGSKVIFWIIRQAMFIFSTQWPAHSQPVSQRKRKGIGRSGKLFYTPYISTHFRYPE